MSRMTTDSAYTLFEPAQRDSAVVFASPHSGAQYPEAFLKRAVLDEQQIRSSEDAFVDQLFTDVPCYGAPLLAATAPRAFLDLNRGPDELDPALISGVRRVAHNPRIASGLGVIPRVVANGRAIYHGKLSIMEAHTRLSTYWRPYHDRLQTLLDQSFNTFGQSILIDCHSMPREALENVRLADGVRPEIVLGDRFGASASSHIVAAVEEAFTACGFRVARNMPFAGAYIAQHYGRPARRQHAVQVEIDRTLYMDEETLTPHDGFAAFREKLKPAIAAIAAVGRPMHGQMAAE